MIISPTYSQSCTITQPTGVYVQPGTCPQSPPIIINGQQYTVAFDDEFTSDQTINSSWSYTNPTFAYPARNGTGDDSYDVDPTKNLFGGYNPFSLSASTGLTITASPITSSQASAPQLQTVGSPVPHWLSGCLTGPPMQYGYFEFSATLPQTTGVWPALWLEEFNHVNSTTDPFPEFVEADTVELFGSNTAFQTLHYTYGSAAAQTTQAVHNTIIPGPHMYGVLITPTSVQFYIDRQPTSPAYPATSVGTMLPIIQLQIFPANSWSLPPATLTPVSMSVQYFRQYTPTISISAN